jgi:hypothetical protein
MDMKTRMIKSAGVLILGTLIYTTLNAQSPHQNGRAGEFAGVDLTE